MSINQADPNKYIMDKLAEANLYLDHGLTENALGVYEELLQKVVPPDHPLRARIEARINKLQTSDAGQPPTPGVPDVGDDNDQRFENCIGLMDAGLHAEAIDQFKSLLKTGYKSGLTNIKIGQCCLYLDRPFEAIEHLENALKDPALGQGEEKLDVLDRLAVTYERTGSIPGAKKALEQIVHLDPKFRNAYDRLKTLSQSAKKFGRFYHLVNTNLLAENQLEQAKEQAKQQKKSIEEILQKNFNIEKKELGKSISEYYGVPFVAFDELEYDKPPACIKGIKDRFFRANGCIPIKEDGNNLIIAADNPSDLAKADNLRTVIKSGEFKFVVCLKEDLDKFIDHFYSKGKAFHAGDDQGDDKDAFEGLELVDEEEEVSLDDDAHPDADGVVVQVTNQIINDGFVRGASDIHIESLTDKRGAKIRFRIDGQCMEYRTIPNQYVKPLISRIKIISKLDIAEKRLPQDGKIKFQLRGKQPIELRVATLPTTGGNEDIVLRILAATSAMPLDKMGILEKNLAKLKQLLATPYGLVLVVGPTGSGKTTTLHAALGHINKPDRKIWTVEDPVEIVQDGLRQVQTHNQINLTFARVLRAFLRADPDVIMVGETRDEETAETVIEAALTGHLVFSTLHTNSAPETVTRLLGMGIDPFNFADSLLGVLAQRLVRRICTECAETYIPDQEELDYLVKEYGHHPTIPLTIEPGISLKRAKGCQACRNTGYKGRVAIHELLTAEDEMKVLMVNNKPVADIREQAMKDGMLTLKQDGIHKVLMGLTDIHMVRAATIK